MHQKRVERKGFTEAGKIQDEALRVRVIAKVSAREEAWRNAPRSSPLRVGAWCGHSETAFRVDTNGIDVCTACAPVDECHLEPKKVTTPKEIGSC